MGDVGNGLVSVGLVVLALLTLAAGLLVGQSRWRLQKRREIEAANEALRRRARAKRAFIETVLASCDGERTEHALLSFLRESLGCTALALTEEREGSRSVVIHVPDDASAVRSGGPLDAFAMARPPPASPAAVVESDAGGFVVACPVSGEHAPLLVAQLKSPPTEDGLALLTLASVWIGAERAKRRDLALLAKSRDDAIATSRAKEDFFADMNHEIRSPLTVVAGVADLLGRAPLGAREQELVAALRSAARRLLGVVNDVLDVAKIESGHFVARAAPFDPHEIAATIVDVHKLELRPGVSLTTDIDAAIPRALVGDAARLEQVLGNLVSNAAKFTYDGRIRLSARLVGETREACTVEFAVEDTGIGIPADRLDQLFERFVQVEGARRRERRGSGLGLAICRGLVERMGGRITVESTEHVGSRFIVRLEFARVALARPEPCSARSPSGAEPCDDGRPGPRPDADAAPVLPPFRVLIADDSPEIALVLEELLRDCGADVRIVADGRAALEAARGEEFDIAFIDLHMGEVDGYETAARLRALEAERGVEPRPLAAMSAADPERTRATVLASGFDAFLAKPIDAEELAALLRRFVPSRFGDAPLRRRTSAVADSARLREYLTNREADLEAIALATQEGDFDAVAAVAHRIQGSSATFGQPELGDVARALETAAHRREVDAARLLIAQARVHVRSAQDTLRDRAVDAPEVRPSGCPPRRSEPAASP